MSAINNKEVGKRIKKIRTESFEKKITLEEFGNLINPPVAKSLVSHWENGINLPNSDRLKQIAELGNVTTDYLLSGRKKNGYGERIRQVRKENNLSKKELANILNQDIYYIETIELENKIPTKRELSLIAILGNTTWERILWSE